MYLYNKNISQEELNTTLSCLIALYETESSEEKKEIYKACISRIYERVQSHSLGNIPFDLSEKILNMIDRQPHHKRSH